LNEDTLKEVTVKIGLERTSTQEEITVKALLDNMVTGSVISSEFIRKQGFKLNKKINSIFNKKRLIEHTVEINIFYKGQRKRIEIDVIEEWKWNVILKIPWSA